MNLIKQREEWKSKFEKGDKPYFPALEDYKRHRDSEYFRLSSGLEELLEYVLYLEDKQRLLNFVENN